MPSGFIPDYEYRPPAQPGEPLLRTASSVRARLFAGGTYFRAREPGKPGNRISVQMIEFEPPASPDFDAVVVVHNHNLRFGENVIGDARVDALDLNLPFDQVITIDRLDTNSPRATPATISAQIGAPAGSPSDPLPFAFSRVFHIPSLLSVRLTPDKPLFTPTDVIVIKPRTRIYRLQRVLSTPEPPLTGELVWDIAALRAEINATDPWVEMLPRSGADPLLGPVFPKFDERDDGIDDPGLTPFGETFLRGGDGLPDNPTSQVTGPSRSLVHINYGERYNGSLSTVNIVYEWAGSTAISGEWRAY